MKKLVASVAIGLTLAISGGVQAYQQQVENQRAAEVAEEEREDNERRQKFLDQISQDDELGRDEQIYNEADRVLRHDVVDWYEATSYEGNAPKRARLKSPKEFEEYFHITPETYQTLCLEKYGINADDFADDTEAEAQQRFDEAKQGKDEYEARSKARREAFERRGRGPEPEWEKPPFTDAELQALQNGDVSYFKKSKESKVKQALNAKISELRWARDEAIRQQLDQADTNQRDDGELPNDVKGEDTGYHPSDSGGKEDSIDMDDYIGARPHGKEADKPDRSGWSDDEIGRRERAYYEQESEQRNREEIQIVDLQ